jgi:phosphate transport system permease protein
MNPQSPTEPHALVQRTSRQRLHQYGDVLFEYITRGFAVLVLGTLLAIMVSLLVTSLPSIRAFGFRFLLSDEWDPVRDQFGALVPIYGTLVSYKK